jgi:hypothetical protein
VDATLFEIFDNLQKMADGAGEAVKPHHDENISGDEFGKQAGQDGAGA